MSAFEMPNINHNLNEIKLGYRQAVHILRIQTSTYIYLIKNIKVTFNMVGNVDT